LLVILPHLPPKVADWILKSDALPFEFFDANGSYGTSRRLPIFFNIGTKKETVQCNQCGVYVNSAHLARHQQAAICDQKARSNAQMQMQMRNAERERLADTVRILKEKPESPFLRPQSALHNLF
jgi:hypothetical protein